MTIILSVMIYLLSGLLFSLQVRRHIPDIANDGLQVLALITLWWAVIIAFLLIAITHGDYIPLALDWMITPRKKIGGESK